MTSVVLDCINCIYCDVGCTLSKVVKIIWLQGRTRHWHANENLFKTVRLISVYRFISESKSSPNHHCSLPWKPRLSHQVVSLYQYYQVLRNRSLSLLDNWPFIYLFFLLLMQYFCLFLCLAVPYLYIKGIMWWTIHTQTRPIFVLSCCHLVVNSCNHSFLIQKTNYRHLKPLAHHRNTCVFHVNPPGLISDYYFCSL